VEDQPGVDRNLYIAAALRFVVVFVVDATCRRLDDKPASESVL
jgi:hypothetical protein